MCGDVRLMCGDVRWCAVMCGFQALPVMTSFSGAQIFVTWFYIDVGVVLCFFTDFSGVWLNTASDHIGLHRTTSDHVWLCLQTRDHNFISEAKMRWNYWNKPPGMQLAHYKLCRHKSSIRPRSSVAYMSPTVSKTV